MSDFMQWLTYLLGGTAWVAVMIEHGSIGMALGNLVFCAVLAALLARQK